MNEVVLSGCTPTPLAGYLKALGVLRLLAAKYPQTRGFWRGDRFVLHTSLDDRSVAEFFLRDYEPTPVLAPWNGGSGFYYQERKSNERDPATGKKKKHGVFDQETSATRTIDSILGSTNGRFGTYKEAIQIAKNSVREFGFITAPEESDKGRLILSLRAILPETCLQSMDACLSIGSSLKMDPVPMFGTGGNDGNLDFTSNFMQRLIDVIGTSSDDIPDQSSDWIHASLFDAVSPCLTINNIGQFSPGQAGGINASTGFEAAAAINPWTFVLMIEGALMFAGAVVRRNADEPAGVLSSPFTVRPVSAGSGSLGEGDASRGELWMPLWQRPALDREVRALMAEGRVALGKKPARDALDFVRAVHHLGGYRGIRSFQRFGLLKRNGKTHFATPLARIEVHDEPSPNLLDELDSHGWLDRFRQFARGDNTANRFLMLRRQLEDRVFDLSGREPSPADAQSLLVLLGDIQRNLAVSGKARESVPPVPRLSERWVTAADDGSPEFRIAKALAGLRGAGEDDLPLRAQVYPVQRKLNQWTTPEAGEKLRIVIGRKGRLVDALSALLEHRLLLTQRLDMPDKPLSGNAGARLDDIAAFLHDDRMDARVAALLPGLSLCEIPRDADRSAGDGTLPAAFGLMRLALMPDRVLRGLGRLGEKEHLPIPAGMLAQLMAGNHDNRAVKIAWRRLRACGLAPFFADTVPGLAGVEPARAAAALLIPLRRSAAAALVRTLLESPEPEAVEASHPLI
jgi:CRISPR-associated protein Csx17